MASKKSESELVRGALKSVKEECLSRQMLLGESSLRRALQQYMEHYHGECHHQGKDHRILFPSRPEARRNLWERCGVENDWGAR
jgi:putative transposase